MRFWNALNVRFVQKSTRFVTCECRKGLNLQHLRRRQVTKPRSFVTKVGTPAQKRKIRFAYSGGRKPSKARQPGKAECGWLIDEPQGASRGFWEFTVYRRVEEPHASALGLKPRVR
jgi:hypothetical protein